MKPLKSMAASPPPQEEEGFDEIPLQPARLAGPRRRWRLILAILMALVIAGWSGLWIVTAQKMASNFNDWLAQEQDAGRVWTCADHRVGGFPFRIDASCDRLSLQTSAGDAPVSATVGELHATAQVFAPHTIVVTVKGPLDVQSGERHPLHADWMSLAVDLTFGDYGLDRAHAIADNPQVHAEDPRFDPVSTDAGRAEADFTVIAGHPVGKTPYKFLMKIHDGRSDDFDRLLGNKDPATIEASGVVSDLDALAGDDLFAIAESWRSAGGGVDLTKALVQKGAIEIAADGRLDVDAQHRPRGRVDVSGSGLEPILARYGISNQALALGGLLTSFFGSSSAPGDPAAGALRIPIKFDNGHVFVGPVRLPFTVRPLY